MDYFGIGTNEFFIVRWLYAVNANVLRSQKPENKRGVRRCQKNSGREYYKEIGGKTLHFVFICQFSRICHQYVCSGYPEVMNSHISIKKFSKIYTTKIDSKLSKENYLSELFAYGFFQFLFFY